MIGYVTLGTNDVSRAADFYDAVLAEIGAKRNREHERYIAWQIGPGQPQLLLIDPYDGNDASVGNGVMVGLRAGSPEKCERHLNGPLRSAAKMKALLD